MTLSTVLILRVAHILAGSFWFGVTVLNAGFLMPAVRSAGPAAGPVMRQLIQVRRLPLYMNTAVLTTLITGFALLWWASGGFRTAWVQSATGVALLAGSGLALVAALIGEFVNAPTAKQMGRLSAEVQAAGGPPAGETAAQLGRLQQRLHRASVVTAILLAGATALMAGARYITW